MAVTYTNAVKDSRLGAVVTAIGGTGKLEICTAAYASILATIPLNATAGVASAGVLTLSGFPKTVAATATGTAAIARIRTGANLDIVTGLTVGLSASDINMDSLSITSGQNVTINASPVINHAA